MITQADIDALRREFATGIRAVHERVDAMNLYIRTVNERVDAMNLYVEENFTRIGHTIAGITAALEHPTDGERVEAVLAQRVETSDATLEQTLTGDG